MAARWLHTTDQCIHAGRRFFFPHQEGFLFFQPQRNKSRRGAVEAQTTADGSSHSEAGGGAVEMTSVVVFKRASDGEP